MKRFLPVLCFVIFFLHISGCYSYDSLNQSISHLKKNPNNFYAYRNILTYFELRNSIKKTMEFVDDYFLPESKQNTILKTLIFFAQKDRDDIEKDLEMIEKFPSNPFFYRYFLLCFPEENIEQKIPIHQDLQLFIKLKYLELNYAEAYKWIEQVFKCKKNWNSDTLFFIEFEYYHTLYKLDRIKDKQIHQLFKLLKKYEDNDNYTLELIFLLEYIHLKRQEWDACIPLIEKGAKLSRQMHLLDYLDELNSDVSYYFSKHAYMEFASNFLKESGHYLESLGNTEYLFKLRKDQGEFYMTNSLPLTALSYLDKASQLTDTVQIEDSDRQLLNLSYAKAWLALEQWDKGIQYVSRLEKSSSMKSLVDPLRVKYLIGKGRLDEARILAEQKVNEVGQAQNNKYKGIYYFYLADIYEKVGYPCKALECGRLSDQCGLSDTEQFTLYLNMVNILEHNNCHGLLSPILDILEQYFLIKQVRDISNAIPISVFQTEKEQNDFLKTHKIIFETHSTIVKRLNTLLMYSLTLFLTLVMIVGMNVLVIRHRKTLYGRYRILEPIGEGGMATIHLARHCKTGKSVAIKILNHSLNGKPDQVDRFIREGDTLQKLDHPNILRFINMGDKKGMPYLVTEYVDGFTLDDLIQAEGPIMGALFKHVVLSICDGMAYTHQKNILHRDLKPSNIMMTRKNKDITSVKIMDFGISKDPQRTQLTKQHTALGSTPYLPPEVFSDECDVKKTGDIYSFGVILYKMATSDLPFTISADSKLTILIHKILTQEPVPPKSINPVISTELNTLILNCLSKNPKERPQSFNELKEMLSVIL